MKEQDLFGDLENQSVAITNPNDSVSDKGGISIFEKVELGKIRVILKDGEPFFCLSDIAKILEIQNIRQLKPMLDEEFNKGGIFYIHPLETAGGMQNFTFINESELYFIVMRSRSTKAKSFRLWVTKEVLPTIRKTGSYSLQPQIPKSYGEALLEAGRLALEKEKLEAQIQADKPLVEFAKDVSQSSNAISVGEFAKLLNTQGIKLGQNKLFAWLRESGYLMHDNEPYQKFIDCGYFATIEQVYQTFNSKQVSLKTLITGKGQIYFHKKLSALFNLKTKITKA